MTSKIFQSILSTSLVVLAACLLIITGTLYHYFEDVQKDQLRNELRLVATATEQLGEPYLQQLKTNQRLTWVDADGVVLYDTQADAAQMENHIDRDEIRQALETGNGSSSRYSATLTEKTLYEALRLSDGTVLRISVSHASAALLAVELLQPIFILGILAALLSGVLANRMAKRVVEPLNHLNLEAPGENDTYEELSPLLSRLHAQQLKIRWQMQSLRQKQKEFDHITSSMKEGLILLDSEGKLVSINPAARSLFGAHQARAGDDFLTIDRSPEMRSALQAAAETGHHEFRTTHNGRSYQLDLSRTDVVGAVYGLVILTFDVTEQANAERSRREFTANVSHELKTPLQSIIGSAELIENGVARPEDISRFIKRIRQEASRLVSLINDIIRLSQLEEGGELPLETVSLRQLTEEVFSILGDAADANSISLTAAGDAEFLAPGRLLFEVVYNLCDNAVKYNTPGGSVHVALRETETEAVISVQDTGIGIPAEHQSRIFERFYRVDKSHSRQSGGTGLGLSIVKHAVQSMNGSLALESTPDKGTTITVTLKKPQQPCIPPS